MNRDKSELKYLEYISADPEPDLPGTVVGTVAKWEQLAYQLTEARLTLPTFGDKIEPEDLLIIARRQTGVIFAVLERDVLKLSETLRSIQCDPLSLEFDGDIDAGFVQQIRYSLLFPGSLQ